MKNVTDKNSTSSDESSRSLSVWCVLPILKAFLAVAGQWRGRSSKCSQVHC